MRRIVLTPDGSVLKVEFRVFDTKRAMHADIRKHYGIENRTQAHTESRLKEVPPGYAAIVRLYRGTLPYGVLEHEVDHVAFTILARRGVKSIPISTEHNSDLEEKHCELVQSICRKLKKHL